MDTGVGDDQERVFNLLFSINQIEGITMIETVKKAVLAGVGAAAVTTEKVEETLKELVEKGKMSANDAKETAKKIADSGKEEFESASRTLQSKFEELMAKVGRGQKERIEELETKIADLEARLAALEGGQEGED